MNGRVAGEFGKKTSTYTRRGRKRMARVTAEIALTRTLPPLCVCLPWRKEKKEGEKRRRRQKTYAINSFQIDSGGENGKGEGEGKEGEERTDGRPVFSLSFSQWEKGRNALKNPPFGRGSYCT